MFVSDLPEEILLKIFSYLPHLELFSTVRYVCSRWNCVCMSQPLWKSLDVEEERNSIQLKDDKDAMLFDMISTVCHNVRKLSFDTKSVPLRLRPITEETTVRSLYELICNNFLSSDDGKVAEIQNGDRSANSDGTQAIVRPNGEHNLSSSDVKICSDQKNEQKSNFSDQNKESRNADCDQGSNKTSQYGFDSRNENDDAINYLPQSNSRFGNNGTDKQTWNLHLDGIEIRETTRSFNFEHLNSFLNCIGSIRVLRIITTKPLLEVSTNHISNLTKVDTLEMYSVFKHEDDNNLVDSDKDNVNKCFQLLLGGMLNITEFSTDVMRNDALRCLLANNRKLRHLSLRNCDDLTKEGFEDMPVLNQLSYLDISNTFIGDKCLERMSESIPNIREFLMEQCVYVTDIGLSYIGKHCDKLQKLIIDKHETSESRNITNVGLEYVAVGCKGLETLVAKYCQGINDVGLLALASNCSKLSVLKVAGCSGITDSGVESIANNCKNMRHINLAKCAKVTHKSINTVIEKCLWLKKLKADGCTFIKDLMINFELHEFDGFTKVKRHSHIRKLSLGFCSNVNDSAIREISNSCPDLRELYLTGTFQVTDNAIDYLLQRCKFLKVLDISCVSILGISEFTNKVLNSVSDNGQNIEKLMLLRNFNIDKDGVGNLLKKSRTIKELHVTVWTIDIQKASGLYMHDCQQICEELNGRGLTTKIQYRHSRMTNKRFADIGIVTNV